MGGGIFVNVDDSPTISNCLIKDNISDHGGGGIYFYTGAGSVVENCIFDGNRSNEPTTSYYTGGGISGQTATSIKVLNCTFVNNTSNQTDGQSILLHSSNNARVINCIVWGSGNEIYLVGTNNASIVNCAVEGTGASSYVNSIDLNSSNTASDGPNFVSESTPDWSIEFISPCRDIGTDTYSGVTIPTTDYDGNNRIGTTDIGTYEVQYSRWKTDATTPGTWLNTGNWEESLHPDHGDATGDVAIPALSSDTYAPNISGSVTIASGESMILEPGSKATFGSITNSGTLRLESDADSTSSLIIGGEGVNANVELYLTGGEAGTGNYRWHYISSPFYTSPSITPFTAVTLNLAQFIQSLYSSTTQAWVAYDGYNYATGMGGTTFSSLSPGKGYNFYDNVNNEITISGQLSYDNLAVGLSFGDNGADYSGFNLIGNPFPAGLNWDRIVDNTYFDYPGSTSTGLYFTRNNVQCSYVAGVGSPGDVTEIIPPMQGFFVKTYSSGNTITLPAAARTHNSIHARYKGKSIIPLVRLSILQFVPSVVVIGPQLTTNDSLINDETVVRFAEQAKPGLDYDFDAVKMFLSDTILSIYSYNGETKYAINGLPFPEGNTEIPLAVTIIEGGDQITISAIQIQGLDNYQVTLKDLVTEFDVDLKTTDLIFTAPPGTYADRFLLTISGTTVIEDIHDLPSSFNVFAANNQLNIKTLSDAWNGKNGTVRIFNLTGRTVSEIHNKEFWKNSILQVPAPPAKGIYFVEIKSGNLRYVGKVSVVK